jgi:fission 1 protein
MPVFHLQNDTLCNWFYLQRFEEEYHRQLATSSVSLQTQFEYAWCLVRSSYYGDIRKGIMLLEDLFKNPAAQDKRDYLYYLAIGYARIKVSFNLKN